MPQFESKDEQNEKKLFCKENGTIRERKVKGKTTRYEKAMQSIETFHVAKLSVSASAFFFFIFILVKGVKFIEFIGYASLKVASISKMLFT